MPNDIKTIAKAVSEMDNYLQTALADTPKKLWKNTYIYHQIEKRKSGGIFTIEDHIRGMVYSMLSSGISWGRVESGIDLKTGMIKPIDDLFHDYDVKYLLQCDPEELRNQIRELHLASLSTRRQMIALITDNIPKLQHWIKAYGSIDNYYKLHIKGDRPINNLVSRLAFPDGEDKLMQMGIALTCEYLKNVGYDLGKPDRHICRILGSTALGVSDMKIVPAYEALNIVADIATELNKPAAEVDYILWSYCAKDYGEICTKPPQNPNSRTAKKPQHDICVAKDICKFKE